MSELTGKIRLRGYVRAEVRPSQFVRDRVPYESLEETLSSSKVASGGWEFPHVGRASELRRGEDWIGSETQWEHRLEAFRFYQSGLLTDLRGFGWDWRDESEFWPKTGEWSPDTSLSVGDTIHRFLETYSFAANLASTSAGDEVMHIRLRFDNLAGRTLVVDERRVHLSEPRRTDMPFWEIASDYQRLDLKSRAQDIALEQTAIFFKRFGWNPTPNLLRDLLYG